MKRVASLFLPDWSIDRLRRAGRIAAPPDLGTVAVATLEARGDGWRPGARWARKDRRTLLAIDTTSSQGERPVVTQMREGSKILIAAVSPAARAISAPTACICAS